MLADLQGPKLRIGEIKDGVILENDADVYITNEEILGDANRFTLKYENLLILEKVIRY